MAQRPQYILATFVNCNMKATGMMESLVYSAVLILLLGNLI